MPTVGAGRSGVYSRLVTTIGSVLSNSTAPPVSGAANSPATMSSRVAVERGGIVSVRTRSHPPLKQR
jgi:hypothetical protein